MTATWLDVDSVFTEYMKMMAKQILPGHFRGYFPPATCAYSSLLTLSPLTLPHFSTPHLCLLYNLLRKSSKRLKRSHFWTQDYEKQLCSHSPWCFRTTVCDMAFYRAGDFLLMWTFPSQECLRRMCRCSGWKSRCGRVWGLWPKLRFSL